MTKWEYMFLHLGGNDANEHTRDWNTQGLNEAGQIGWELVSVTTGGGTGGSPIWAIFKRPLSE